MQNRVSIAFQRLYRSFVRLDSAAGQQPELTRTVGVLHAQKQDRVVGLRQDYSPYGFSALHGSRGGTGPSSESRTKFRHFGEANRIQCQKAC